MIRYTREKGKIDERNDIISNNVDSNDMYLYKLCTTDSKDNKNEEFRRFKYSLMGIMVYKFNM